LGKARFFGKKYYPQGGDFFSKTRRGNLAGLVRLGELLTFVDLFFFGGNYLWLTLQTGTKKVA
jgi:hypothetical protein